MRLFITAKYQPGQNQDYLTKLRQVVKQAGFVDFCFATDITTKFSTPNDLMKSAQAEILGSDVLLFDVTQAGTGRAIEVGIAFQAGKQIIVIAQKGTIVSDTVSGVANIVLEYTDLNDLLGPLKNYLSTLC